MRANKFKTFAFLLLSSISSVAYGQAETSGANYMLIALIVLGGIVLLGAIISLADNLLQVEADKAGLDTSADDYGILSFGKNFLKAKAPVGIPAASFHKLNKGYDIKLEGKATSVSTGASVTRFAVKPGDYRGISPIPKVLVTPGTEVKAGEVLFFDKKRPEVKYVSPVSGEVIEVNRGAKRSIKDVVILADKDQKYVKNAVPGEDADRSAIVDYMQASGAWTLLNRRPYDILPATDAVPANIFVSTFDSAPLAPVYNDQVAKHKEAFQTAINLLNKLTIGKVFLGIDANASDASDSVFSSFENVEKHYFAGKHPYGNVGIQMHHVAPITKGTEVWTLGVNEMITLGYLFLTGEYRTDRAVFLTGNEMDNNRIIHTYQGASISDLIGEQSLEGKRLIQGNVLTGDIAEAADYLSAKVDHLTAIKEGDDYELFGWLLPVTPRPSISRTFPTFLFPNHEFEGETNTHGEKRAFVVTGQYESVLPMDLYPQHLMKAIIANDYEKMEGLGIAELSEEDLAICEFVCTSKQPLQSILREGLDMMRDQE